MLRVLKPVASPEENANEEETVYDEETREMLLENDELEAFEEAFMRGWDEAY